MGLKMLKHFYWVLVITTVTTETLREVSRTNNDGRYTHRDTPQLRRFETVHKMTQTADQSKIFENKPILCEIKQDIANCSHRNIINIGEISLPDNITSLDLSVNNIEDIPDGALSNFTQLTFLNMSKNNIQKLNNGSFYNLTALQFLDLYSNNLSMNGETFPVGVFEPLVGVTHLWMHNNTNVDDAMLDYPDTALSYLSNLTSLWIDGLPNKVFSVGFQSLTSLINLTLQGQPHGHCHLISLPGDMFDNLGNLRHLALRRCNIKGTFVDRRVFVPLTKLTSLDLTNNVALHFDYLQNALKMIVGYTNLTKLIIPTINNPYYPAICVNKKFAMSLPRGLEILDVTSNSIESLEHGALENLPKNLKYIYINDNRFAFASYLKDLDKLENLLELSIATWNTHILPKYYPPEEPARTCGDASRTAGSDYNSYLTQSLPPKIQTIQITNAGWSNYLDEFHFNPNNTVKDISLDWNNFPKLIGPIIGLNYLESISLVGCNIKEIHYTFFQNLTSLKSVNLAGNIFEAFPPGTPSPFIWLKSLTFLGLDFSDLQIISYDTFQGLNNLTTLLLDRNPIYNFDIDLSNMTHLIFMNLSKTLLSSFNPKTRKMLDEIHSISNLTVHFPGDKLACQCSDLDFIQWMATTSVLTRDTEYYCNDREAEIRVPNLVELYKSKQKECVTNYQLLSIVISCTCLLVIIMVAAIMYRLRWKLWYLYYAAILHYSGGNKNRDKRESFDFDIFISYTQEDHEFVVDMLYPQLVSRGLRVHIHGLHFVAGQYISANIVNAVQSSRRTLVVLTGSHVRSKWSKFEIEMANIEQVQTGRRVLLFLIMETLPKLNRNVLFHIKNNTYMKFPATSQDQLTMQMFWTRLVSDLQS